MRAHHPIRMTGALRSPGADEASCNPPLKNSRPRFHYREGATLATETTALAGLEPRAFWNHFERLTRIARPSRHEEPVIDYVRAWGEERGYRVRQDAARNLVFDVPATSGRESSPTVVLQG